MQLAWIGYYLWHTVSSDCLVQIVHTDMIVIVQYLTIYLKYTKDCCIWKVALWFSHTAFMYMHSYHALSCILSLKTEIVVYSYMMCCISLPTPLFHSIPCIHNLLLYMICCIFWILLFVLLASSKACMNEIQACLCNDKVNNSQCVYFLVASSFSVCIQQSCNFGAYKCVWIQGVNIIR